MTLRATTWLGVHFCRATSRRIPRAACGHACVVASSSLQGGDCDVAAPIPEAASAERSPSPHPRRAHRRSERELALGYQSPSELRVVSGGSRRTEPAPPAARPGRASIEHAMCSNQSRASNEARSRAEPRANEPEPAAEPKQERTSPSCHCASKGECGTAVAAGGTDAHTPPLGSRRRMRNLPTLGD